MPKSSLNAKRILHLVWPLPESRDSNKHLRTLIQNEARACTGLDAVCFAGETYLARLNDPATERPDLVVLFGSFNQPYLDLYSLIAGIRQQTECPLAAWLTEDPYEFDSTYPLPGLVDWIFSNDKSSCAYYHAPRIAHLPLAAAELPDPKTPPSAEWDFVFCGAAFPNRTRVLEGLLPTLTARKTLIVGDFKSLSSAGGGVTVQASISYEELLDVYRRSRIVLNLSRAFDLCNNLYQIVGSTPAPRTFEVAALGTLQFAFFDKPELIEYYAPDTEIVTFARADEFAAKADRFLNDAALRTAVAGAARARTEREHRYRHRLETLARTVWGEGS